MFNMFNMPKGVISAPSTDPNDPFNPHGTPMPSVTELGMQAVSQDYGSHSDPSAIVNLGQQAMAGNPVYTDSSQQTVYTPEEKKTTDWSKWGEAFGIVGDTLAQFENKDQGMKVSSSAHRPGFRPVKDNSFQAQLVGSHQQQAFSDPGYINTGATIPQSTQDFLKRVM